MTTAADELSWLTPFLQVLPQSNHLIFKQIWKNSRFAYKDSKDTLDAYDIWNARAISAATYLNRSLLVVLPDYAPHRAPVLFASCLVADALDTLNSLESYPEPQHNVLYFGTSVGIRDQLGSVKVSGLSLDSVFPLFVAGRSQQQEKVVKPKLVTARKHGQAQITTSLPRVICIYSPVDPAQVVDQYEPTWLAIDCSNVHQIHWLPMLLKHALNLELPVVAWCQNPLSDAVSIFQQHGGLVLNWGRTQPRARSVSNFDTKTPIETYVQPTTLSPSSDGLVKHLVEASAALGEVARLSARDEQLVQDALRVGWRYLRSLEYLVVPIELYEAEITRFWGGITLHQLNSTFSRFVEAIGDSSLPVVSQLFRQILNALNEAHNCLKSINPPVWALLSEWIHSSSNADSQIWIFPTESMRQLVVFGFLSRYNLTESELKNTGIWLTTYSRWYKEYTVYQQQKSQIHNEQPHQTPIANSGSLPLSSSHNTILVGVPSAYHSPFIEPILDSDAVNVIAYEYQIPLLRKRIREWRRQLELDPQQVLDVLKSLSKSDLEVISVPPIRSLLHLSEAATHNISTRLADVKYTDRLVDPLDAVDELSRVFTFGDIDDESLSTVDETGPETDSSALPQADGDLDKWTEESLWVSHIIEIKFENGWALSVPTDNLVQIVARDGTKQIQPRYARAVRKGDKLLLIVGQRRQSLYDLIVSRVHAHPAIEVHLAMIRRWQQDFAGAYRLWRRRNQNNVHSLLDQMQSQGSSLISAQTIRLWLMGGVLCPENADDLRRLGIILDLPFLRENYKHIHKAANRLSGIHRALSRRLNQWLQNEAFNVQPSSEGDTTVLDSELGLTFSDFRDSLMVLTVETVQESQGLFLRQNLGRLIRIGT